MSQKKPPVKPAPGPEVSQSRGGEACPTWVVSDVPAEEDAFGPHSRIASAIADSIRREPGGQSIGIAGPWGTGKSTTVHLLGQHLSDEDNCRLWVFDAWAHEGDPLRRSFLEGLIEDLLEAKWLVPETFWRAKLKQLSRKQRHEVTKTRAKVTRGGYVVGISLLLVPLGTAVFHLGASRGIEVSLGATPNWLAVVGVLMVLSPAVTPGLTWLLMRGFSWLVPLVRQKYEPPTIAELYTPIARVHDTEVTSESFEGPEPSSVDFARTFKNILAHALSDSQSERKLVVVLDNLDRVASTEQAQRIWSTLQPYMQPPARGASWQRRLRMIVTYDRYAMVRLSPTQGENANIHGQSYIDKTIRVEYNVPFPVLSNWRRYVRDKLAKAMPHHDTVDFDAVVRLLSVAYPTISDGPAPRELVQIVNSIGALHRQWSHEIPLLHIAYFVLAERNRWNWNTNILPEFQRLVGSDVLDDLYSLKFGVSHDIARQLRVGDPALSSLASGDLKAFKELEENTEGTWAVVDVLLSQRISDWEASAPSNLLRALGVISRLDDGRPIPAGREVVRTLSEAVARVEEWDALDPATDIGFSSIVADEEVIRRYFEQRSASLQKEWSQKEALSDQTIRSLEALVDTLEVAGVSHEATLTVSDADLYSELVSNTTKEAKSKRNHPIWSAIRFEGEPDQATRWLATPGSGNGNRYVIRALANSQSTVDWSQLARGMRNQLTGGSAEHSLSEAMSILLEANGIPAGKGVVRTLSKEGHWRSIAKLAAKEEDAEALAIGVLLFVEASEGDSAPNVSWAGKVNVKFQRAVGTNLFTLADEFNSVARVWDALVGSQVIPIIQGFCDASIGSDAPHFSAELVVRDDRMLRRAQRLNPAVKSLPDKPALIRLLREGDFTLSRADLYQSAVSSTGDPELCEWLVEELATLEETAWTKGFENRVSTHMLSQLVTELRDQGFKVHLGPSCAAGLITHLPVVRLYLDSLLPSMDEASRASVHDAFFDWALKERAFSKARFYKRSGETFASASQFRNLRVDVVKKIFLPIVQNKTYSLEGISWLTHTLEQNPEVLERRGKRKRKSLLTTIRSRLDDESLSQPRREALECLETIVSATL